MKKILLLFSLSFNVVYGQKANDVTTPLHALQPAYPVPYGAPAKGSVKAILDKVFNYLDEATPSQFENRKTSASFSKVSIADTNIVFKAGDFRLTSYEWGVTYSGMLQVAKETGDNRYAEYTIKRLALIADAVPAFQALNQQFPKSPNPLRTVISPHALDDAGAICAATIKTYSLSKNASLKPVIDNFIKYISNNEYRLADGTFARKRPLMNSLWLDDLYMSVPALAQMGKLSGQSTYYDDAIRQILQFSKRMFNKDLNIYMHGWIEGMSPHPEFHWARANGWALMAMTELLDVLPADYKGRADVLEQYRAHVKGLAALQAPQGLWHQLLDKNDSYLETSASAIYTYCIARGISQGWLDAKAYSPMVLLAWNAISTKINDKGQVEGTCVGTGMGFDPAFYYYRPTNLYAAHGYGPVLLAGAEIIHLLNTVKFQVNDSATMIDDNK
ncbi:glycoside hydrolase family 88/105 protein [Pinibacter soli]|uniref:Glycoside hydrolase family 88 protein n=1 Tax=Pinibacter soli TaxID=3044211 RepID=A0ABT6R9Y1_9BACT|nr:glycoside hydrolase family 88 protein [Pinibacter soli]MDI3319276.1 glycoside hydrolase family 88 protein [Pinibacter soli]